MGNGQWALGQWAMGQWAMGHCCESFMMGHAMSTMP